VTNRRWLILVSVVFIGAASVANGQAMRKDLADLARQIALVRDMHPDISASAAIRASLGTLGDTEESPRIGLTLYKPVGRARIVEKVGVVLDPEEELYSSAAAFDRLGRLDGYSGHTLEATRRFAELDKFQAALSELGAPFAATPPTIATCRSLRIIATALGSAVPVGTATRMSLAGTKATARELGRHQLAWAIDLAAQRGDTAVTYWIRVDPWGEVLWVHRDGGPLP
jgi:hypothetical protein